MKMDKQTKENIKDLENSVNSYLEDSNEVLKDAHEFYMSFVKNCFLLHSGATIAVLGIISALISTNNKALALSVTGDIKFFIFGVIYTTFIYLLGSAMLYSMHDDIKRTKKHIKNKDYKKIPTELETITLMDKVSNNMWLSMIGASIPLLLFIYGCYSVNSSFVKYLGN